MKAQRPTDRRKIIRLRRVLAATLTAYHNARHRCPLGNCPVPVCVVAIETLWRNRP